MLAGQVTDGTGGWTERREGEARAAALIRCGATWQGISGISSAEKSRFKVLRKEWCGCEFLPEHTSVLRVYVVCVCVWGGIGEIIRLSDWQTDREGAVLMRVLTHPQGGGGAARCSNGEQRCGTARRSGSAAPRGAWPDLAAARRRQATMRQVCGAYPAQQLLSLSCHSLQSSDKKIYLPGGQALVSDAETALYVYDSETALEPETVHVVSRRRGHSVDAGEFFLSLSLARSLSCRVLPS